MSAFTSLVLVMFVVKATMEIRAKTDCFLLWYFSQGYPNEWVFYFS